MSSCNFFCHEGLSPTSLQGGGVLDAPNLAHGLETLPVQVAALGAGGRLAIAVRGAVLLRTVSAQQPKLASLVGTLSLDGQPRSPAARLQRRALAPLASVAPAHSHFRPPWAERGVAVGLQLSAHAMRIAVPLQGEHISRCAADRCNALCLCLPQTILLSVCA